MLASAVAGGNRVTVDFSAENFRTSGVNKFMSKVVASFYTRPNYVAHNWEPNVFRGFRKFRFITVLMVWNDRVNSVKYVSV